jgi:hypothetical protein
MHELRFLFRDSAPPGKLRVNGKIGLRPTPLPTGEKRRVPWPASFLEDGRNLRHGERPVVERPNYKAIRL